MKRLVTIGSCIAIAALLASVFLFRPGQTRFGGIKKTRRTEPHPPTLLQSLLLTNTRQRNYLLIGGAEMEWRLMSTALKTGWLCFAKPESHEPLWEFGPCSRSDLREVVPGDLNLEFVRNGDTNLIKSAFDGDSWFEKFRKRPLGGTAIPVKEGQIILARRIGFPRTIYAMRLVDQRGTQGWGSIDVEYLTIDLSKAEPDGAATAAPPRR